MIHAVIGTKAEYIKTAPVLRELQRRGVAYRLVDVGQHAGLPRQFRSALGVGDPDVRIDDRGDAETVVEAAAWMLRTSRNLLKSKRRLRREIFAGEPGICLVHGDTPSTLLATLIARRSGFGVAHLESGLRSHHLLHPFPEELTRIMVMRLATVLYAPDEQSAENLERMKVKGEIVCTGGNTSVDAVAHVMPDIIGVTSTGPGLVTVHRVENLHRRGRLDALVDLLALATAKGPVRFHVHQPTELALRKAGRWDAVAATGAMIEPLISHQEFLAEVRRAPWVVTDGGSIQEECAMLGVPTLLWRARTERQDGLDANVVVSNYDSRVVDDFLSNPQEFRRRPTMIEQSPAAFVVDHLLGIGS